jgi:hypothetical protein
MPSILNGDQTTEQRVRDLYNANYTEGRVYPTLAAGTTVASANVDWVLGTVTELIPANTVTTAYHVSLVSVESCDENAVFELALYYGAANTLMSTVRFAVNGGFFGNQLYLVPSVKVPANSKLSGALASSNGTAAVGTITMSVVYRELRG